MEIDSNTLAIITSILALIGTIVTAVFGFRSKLPEAADDVASGFQKFTTELRNELEIVRTEVFEVKAELAKEKELRKKFEAGVAILIQQLRENGIKPRWTLKDIEE